MTTESIVHNDVSPFQRGSRNTYLIVEVLLLLSILVQGFVAGVFLFGAGTWGQAAHSSIALVVLLLALIQLILSLLSRFPAVINWTSALLFVLVIVQILLGGFGKSAPMAGALHPANALLLIALNTFLIFRAWQISRSV